MNTIKTISTGLLLAALAGCAPSELGSKVNPFVVKNDTVVVAKNKVVYISDRVSPTLLGYDKEKFKALFPGVLSSTKPRAGDTTTTNLGNITFETDPDSTIKATLVSTEGLRTVESFTEDANTMSSWYNLSVVYVFEVTLPQDSDGELLLGDLVHEGTRHPVSIEINPE